MRSHLILNRYHSSVERVHQVDRSALTPDFPENHPPSATLLGMDVAIIALVGLVFYIGLGAVRYSSIHRPLRRVYWGDSERFE